MGIGIPHTYKMRVLGEVQDTPIEWALGIMLHDVMAVATSTGAAETGSVLPRSDLPADHAVNSTPAIAASGAGTLAASVTEPVPFKYRAQQGQADLQRAVQHGVAVERAKYSLSHGDFGLEQPKEARGMSTSTLVGLAALLQPCFPHIDCRSKPSRPSAAGWHGVARALAGSSLTAEVSDARLPRLLVLELAPVLVGPFVSCSSQTRLVLFPGL
eukprot:756188-Hanusia_phi.AAC.3